MSMTLPSPSVHPDIRPPPSSERHFLSQAYVVDVSFIFCTQEKQGFVCILISMMQKKHHRELDQLYKGTHLTQGPRLPCISLFKAHAKQV